jgi:hypothetical protein
LPNLNYCRHQICRYLLDVPQGLHLYWQLPLQLVRGLVRDLVQRPVGEDFLVDYLLPDYLAEVLNQREESYRVMVLDQAQDQKH